jgi:hypothetical protein
MNAFRCKSGSSCLYVFSFLLIVLFLEACTASKSSFTDTSQTPPGLPAEEVKRTNSVSILSATTQSPVNRSDPQIPTVTPAIFEKWTSVPSSTPLPPTLTSSIIESPSPFATFDVHLIRTATPSTAEKCPQVKPESIATPEIYDKEGRFIHQEDIRAFLNQYGPQPFLKGKAQEYSQYLELTHDGIPEFIFSTNSLYIFGCKNGQYVKLFALGPDAYSMPPGIEAIQDINKNGIPELYVLTARGTQGSRSYRVLEWDGNKFRDLFDIPPSTFTDRNTIKIESGTITFEDFNQDGMQELVTVSGQPLKNTDTANSGGPWRKLKTYYRWDGMHLMYYKKIFDPPKYRFQAVLDGDQASRDGDLDQALNLYQQAISSDQLEWWSIERALAEKLATDPNPVLPPPDINEYPNLAAYSLYRIMLIHLVNGYSSDAQAVFTSLQKRSPTGKPGHAYNELAQVFLDEFTNSKNFAISCKKAIEYAAAHPDDIFTYLDGYYGWQAPYYKQNPEIICPFK